MPKIKENPFSHDADFMHHGAISREMMPTATAIGDMLYWDGNQWQFIRLTVGGGLDLSYNAQDGTLELYFGAGRVYASATMDAVLQGTVSGGFTADAVLV